MLENNKELKQRREALVFILTPLPWSEPNNDGKDEDWHDDLAHRCLPSTSLQQKILPQQDAKSLGGPGKALPSCHPEPNSCGHY